MSNVGQAALIVVGTVVGAYFGQPQLGFVLGGLVGSALFPTQLPNGPKITDNRTTTATIGVPVPLLFGTADLAGTVIWLAPMVEHQNKQGGKGGPVQTTFSYTQSIAIGLCERVDDTAPDEFGAIGGISRVWENGTLVYDIRPQQHANTALGTLAETDRQYANRLTVSAAYADTFTLYYGDELQEADPTIEAVVGFGNAPGFRGLAYIVYPNRQLRNDQGLRHPSFTFECYQSATNCRDVVTTSNEVLYPWFDSRNEYTYTIQVMEAHSPTTGANPSGMTSSDIATLLAAARAFNGINQSVQIGYTVNNACGGNSNSLVPLPGSYDIGQVVGGVTIDPTCVQLNYNFAIPHDGFQLPAGDPNTDPTSIHRSANKTWWQERTIWHTTDVPGSNDFGFPPWDVPYRYGSRDVAYWWYEQVDDLIIQQYRRPGPPPAPCYGLTPATQAGYALDAFGNLVKCDTWVKDTSQTYKVLQKFVGETGAGVNSNFKTQHPLGPALAASDPNFSSAAFWTSAYAAAVARGDMPAGLVYNTDYPQTQAFAWTLTQRVCTGTCTDSSELSNDVLRPWNVGGIDPRAAGQQYTYQFQRADGGTDRPFRSSLEVAMGDAVDGGGLNTPFTLQSRLYGWSSCGSVAYNGTLEPWYSQAGIISTEACYPPVDARHMPTTYMWFNRLVPNGPLDYSVINVTESYSACQFIQSKPSGFWWIGESNYSGTVQSIPGHGIMTWPFPTDYGSFNCTEGNSVRVTWDNAIRVDAVPSAPPDPCFGLPVSAIPGYCVREDGMLIKGGAWTLDTSKTYKVLHSDRWTSLSPYVSYLNPCLAPDDPNYSDSAFWTAAYNAAVIAGDLPAGFTYGSQYPQNQMRAWKIDIELCEAGGAAVSVASIIAAICKRAGLIASQIDVSDLTGVFVDGYSISSLSDGTNIISPLRSVAFFDCVESGNVLRFPRRGKEIVATLTEEQIGCYDSGSVGNSGGSQTNIPPSVAVTRQDETTMPRSIRFHYKGVSRDYQNAEQQSPFRLTTRAVNDQDISIPLCIGDVQAAQAAEIIWSDAWAAQKSYSIAIDQSLAALEGADCIGVPVDGVIQRMRIVSDTNAAFVLRKLALVGDNQGSYISYAVAEPPQRAPSVLSFLAPSLAVFLNIPALVDSDNNAGFYVVAYPNPAIGNRWPGATFWQSIDGTNYTQSVSSTQAATVGTLQTAVPASESFSWDTSTVITVNLPATQSFESRTDDAVLAGANAAAMGADGRWEIIQFATATQVSPTQWHLSRLLRGRRGTEHVLGTSRAGDQFVIVSTGDLVRIPLSVAQIGAAYVYKVVTDGATFSSGSTYDFTSRGSALIPFSPVDVAANFLTGGDIEISWTRRDRLGRTLMSGTDMPLSDMPLQFQVDILDPVSPASPAVAFRTLSSSVPSVVYTQSAQHADFGSPAPTSLRVAVYQISSTIGRGIAEIATITVGI